MEPTLPFIPAITPAVLPFVQVPKAPVQPLPAAIHQPSVNELNPPILTVEVDLALAELALTLPPVRIRGFRVPATPCTQCGSRFNPWQRWTSTDTGATHQRCG